LSNSKLNGRKLEFNTPLSLMARWKKGKIGNDIFVLKNRLLASQEVDS